MTARRKPSGRSGTALAALPADGAGTPHGATQAPTAATKRESAHPAALGALGLLLPRRQADSEDMPPDARLRELGALLARAFRRSRLRQNDLADARPQSVHRATG